MFQLLAPVKDPVVYQRWGGVEAGSTHESRDMVGRKMSPEMLGGGDRGGKVKRGWLRKGLSGGNKTTKKNCRENQIQCDSSKQLERWRRGKRKMEKGPCSCGFQEEIRVYVGDQLGELGFLFTSTN